MFSPYTKRCFLLTDNKTVLALTLKTHEFSFIDREIYSKILFVTLFYVDACFVLNAFHLFVFGPTAPVGPGPPHSRSLQITHNDALHSVGLLWTSHQLLAETCT